MFRSKTLIGKMIMYKLMALKLLMGLWLKTKRNCQKKNKFYASFYNKVFYYIQLENFSNLDSFKEFSLLNFTELKQNFKLIKIQ